MLSQEIVFQTASIRSGLQCNFKVDHHLISRPFPLLLDERNVNLAAAIDVKINSS